eukprot:4451437-Amphidinium_carterae.1
MAFLGGRAFQFVAYPEARGIVPSSLPASGLARYLLSIHYDMPMGKSFGSVFQPPTCVTRVARTSFYVGLLEHWW